MARKRELVFLAAALTLAAISHAQAQPVSAPPPVAQPAPQEPPPPASAPQAQPSAPLPSPPVVAPDPQIPTRAEAPTDDPGKTQREKDDLVAQQSMARSAENMFQLAVAQLVVGVVTVGFLWSTWREARRSAMGAENAAMAAERSVRSLMSAEMAHITVEKVSTPQLSQVLRPPKFELFLHNSGSTPGYIAGATLRFAPAPRSADIADLEVNARGGESRWGYFLASQRPLDPTDGYGTDPILPQEVADLCARRTQLFVWGHVEFETTFGEKWISGFGFRLAYDNAGVCQKAVAAGGRRIWRYERVPEPIAPA